MSDALYFVIGFIIGFPVGYFAACLWLKGFLNAGFFTRQWNLRKCRMGVHQMKLMSSFDHHGTRVKIHQCKICSLYHTERTTIHPPKQPAE